MNTVLVLDLLVPFGRILRKNKLKPFTKWKRVVLEIIPQTFFIYWLFSLIPFVGTFIYSLILIPLSAKLHIKIFPKEDFAKTLLLYYVVIVIGFGGLWSFIGHTILADSVAQGIGWATGSPFQTELAFYTLGSGVAGILAIWLRGHMITGLVISKSIFLLGAAYVHIKDAIINANYAYYNIGPPLVGDIVFPAIYLTLLYITLKDDLKK